MAARRGRFRTKLCRNFALGHCPQGDKCNYIHASPESIQTNCISPMAQTSISQRSNDDPLSASTFSPPLWPTLSPTTNASSDQPAYNLSTSSPTGRPSSRIKYRSLSWRTTLCRHYLKNRGWCPLGDDCNYIHDLTLAEFAKDDVRFANRRNSSGTGGKYVLGERGKMGSKHSHCWAYVQGLCHVADCQYLHPAAVQMFAAHTPCLAWPNCRRGPLCPYKHPEPYASQSPSASPSASPIAPPANANTHAPPTQLDTVPRGAVQYNGMFYFAVPPQHTAPSLLAPPNPIPQSAPLPPQPQLQPTVIFTNPWEGWQLPYTPAAVGYTPVAVNSTTWPAIGFNDSLSSNRPHAPNPALGLQPIFPPSSRPAGVSMPYESPSPYQEDAIPRQMSMSMSLPMNASMSMANYSIEEPSGMTATLMATSLGMPDRKARAYSTPAEEFPYVPPKEQRNGHARRISVSTRGVNREAMDALGLDSSSIVITTATTTSNTTNLANGRFPWQTHSDRLARRSWAPSSSSLRTSQATPSPALYRM